MCAQAVRAIPGDDARREFHSGEQNMRIGAFAHGWWLPTCEGPSHDAAPLPVAQMPNGNPYSANLAARLALGPTIAAKIEADPVEFLLDNGGTGLALTADQSAHRLKMVHEAAAVPLVSHFIDPLVTAFQGLDWAVLWQCLQSESWIKAVWDLAQVAELKRFGVPNVIHLPMAAPDRSYDTRPLDIERCRPIVSFVGGQNTSYFSANQAAPTATLLPGILAQSIRSGLPNAIFLDAYYDVFGLSEAPADMEPVATRAAKAATYFNAKLFYNAQMCIRNRDRFVIFLSRKLGSGFELVGEGWDRAYGLTTAPRLETTDAYFDHFRQCAINLNLVNGNAETGLNMRHFEITAAGGFMMCYEQPELAMNFEVGKECVVFHNESDLLEKIDYYIKHPQERAAIALAGQQRTLSSHLYSHRLRAVVDAVDQWKSRSAVPESATMPGSIRPAITFADTQFWEDLKSFVPEADVVLDCGGNVGQSVGGFRNLYPDADIYSFEPVSSVFGQLEAQCAKLEAQAVKKAVSDRDGKTTIHLTASNEANSLLGFQEGNPCAKWTREVGEEEIETCTLDRWCVENDIDPSRVDVLKLDVQGAELKALEGAATLLKSAKAVYTEVSFVPIYKDCPLLADVDDFMLARGYQRHALYPSDQPHNWGDALYVKK